HGIEVDDRRGALEMGRQVIVDVFDGRVAGKLEIVAPEPKAQHPARPIGDLHSDAQGRGSRGDPELRLDRPWYEQGQAEAGVESQLVESHCAFSTSWLSTPAS